MRSPKRTPSLNDSRSVPHLVASSAATWAITLVDPRTLDGTGLRAYRAANAAFAAWMTWAVLSTENADMSRGARIGLTAGGAALGLASARWSERWDGRLHDALERRGARRPRLVLAAGSTALGVLGWWRARQDAAQEAEARGFVGSPATEGASVPAESERDGA